MSFIGKLLRSNKIAPEPVDQSPKPVDKLVHNIIVFRPNPLDESSTSRNTLKDNIIILFRVLKKEYEKRNDKAIINTIITELYDKLKEGSIEDDDLLDLLQDPEEFEKFIKEILLTGINGDNDDALISQFDTRGVFEQESPYELSLEKRLSKLVSKLGQTNQRKATKIFKLIANILITETSGGRKSRRNINANKKSKATKKRRNHKKSKRVSTHLSKSVKYHKKSRRN